MNRSGSHRVGHDVSLHRGVVVYGRRSIFAYRSATAASVCGVQYCMSGRWKAKALPAAAGSRALDERLHLRLLAHLGPLVITLERDDRRHARQMMD
jgi:hypothetical protein